MPVVYPFFLKWQDSKFDILRQAQFPPEIATGLAQTKIAACPPSLSLSIRITPRAWVRTSPGITLQYVAMISNGPGIYLSSGRIRCGAF